MLAEKVLARPTAAPDIQFQLEPKRRMPHPPISLKAEKIPTKYLMLQSSKQLSGDSFGDDKGEFGRLKDFYFGEKNSAFRNLVVETGR